MFDAAIALAILRIDDACVSDQDIDGRLFQGFSEVADAVERSQVELYEGDVGLRMRVADPLGRVLAFFGVAAGEQDTRASRCQAASSVIANARVGARDQHDAAGEIHPLHDVIGSGL